MTDPLTAAIAEALGAPTGSQDVQRVAAIVRLALPYVLDVIQESGWGKLELTIERGKLENVVKAISYQPYAKAG